MFNVYDLNDPDWILVSDATQKEFGFIPSNYIQLGQGVSASSSSNQLDGQSQPQGASTYNEPLQDHTYQQQQHQQQQQQPPLHIQLPPASSFPPPPTHISRSAEPEIPPPTPQKDYPRQLEAQSPLRQQRQSYGAHQGRGGGGGEENEENEEEERKYRGNNYNSGGYNNNGGDYDEGDTPPPPMPTRPSEPEVSVGSSSQNYEREQDVNEGASKDHTYDGEFFTWYIDEVDGRKKRPVKLSIGQNLIILKPNITNPKKLRLKSASHLDNEWRIKDLKSFSSEKKHLFLELKNPTESIELHTGTKDVADAITAILGDLKGAEEARGLREVEKASQARTGGSNKKIGRLLYDFKAQGDDELNCREGDEVYIIDESKSRDWWMVQNTETRRQGVVPSSYIEIISTSNLDKLTDGPQRRKSTKGKVVSSKDRHRQRNREERERVREHDRSQRERQSKSHSESDKSMPNYHRVRTWIDSSGTFKVEAEFLGFVEGKVHLHKTNGVKIAVAAEKLSLEDLEYVEKITGNSLESYKEMVQRQMEKRARSKSKSGATSAAPSQQHSGPSSRQSATAAINDIPPPQPSRPKSTTRAPSNGTPAYDWFDFFLECGVDVGNCQRYTLNFEREQMDENILEDISPSLLRTLGLREGDIIRVMKHLDTKFNRKRSVEPPEQLLQQQLQQKSGSLFVDSSGALKNNSSTEVFKVSKDALPSPVKAQQTINSPGESSSKIEDDAWAMKPAARSNENLLKPSPQPQTQQQTQPQTPQYTGSLSDLVNIKPRENKVEPQSTIQTQNQNQTQTQTPSLPPLQPTKTASNVSAQTGGTLVPAQRTGGFVPIQRTGAGIVAAPTGGFLPAQPTGFIPITAQPTGFVPIQQTGMLQPQITIGILPLQPAPTNQQRTGSAPPMTTFGSSSQFQPGFVPLQTGNLTMPQTSFGTQQQNTGGLPFTSFNQNINATTGNMPQTSFGQNPLVPAQRTGGTQITGGFVPQSNFGKQITGGFMNTNNTFGQQQPTGGAFPSTTFGQQQQQPTGGAFSLTTFGQPQQQPTGGAFPPITFGTQFTGGTAPFGQSAFNQSTGHIPSTSFGQPFSQPNFPLYLQPNVNQFGQQQQQQQQQQQPNMNQMTNMFQNTSIGAPQGQMPTTSFGQSQFEGFNSQPLQSQPTGMGFGNAPLQSQQTGRRANLAAATPDNPFGF